MKKTKRAGLLTKLVILAILIVLSISLLNLRARLNAAASDRDALQVEVDEQTQRNAALKDDLENSDDPEVVLQVAKEKLGLVSSNEVIIYDSSD